MPWCDVAVQEPVGKWQEVEGDGGSGAKKGTNLLELFYADPKRCVPFSCVIWYTPTGPCALGGSLSILAICKAFKGNA